MSNNKLICSLKEKLELICEKIELILKKYKESAKFDKYLKQTQDIYNANSVSKIKVIKNLKQNITLIQNNLDKIYDINKINKIQSEIKKKSQTIKNLSKEQLLLCNLVKKQQESIEDYSSKFTTNKEISVVRNKLKFEKEENHMNRETFKLIEAKIKGQLSKIDVLEKKSKIIRQNIEFQQRKQKKEFEKSINGGENEDQIGSEDDINQNDLDYLMVTEKMLILEIEDEEGNFKNELNKQNIFIKQILDKINNLKERKTAVKLKIKENERNKKLEVIKIKEKKRTVNKNDVENIISRNNINHKINYQTNLYQSQKFIYKNGESPNNKNENININIYTNTKSNTKPFDIKKFNLMYNNNYSAKIIMDSNSNLSNPKIFSSMNNYYNERKINKCEENNQINKNISPLEEIEQLRNEIKYALKNYIAVVNIHNGEIREDKKDDNINDKTNIKKMNLNYETNNKKSNKPFEKFNFNS